MFRKDLILAILATFCLTSTLFMAIPTTRTTGEKQYDPWLDVNDDGIINMIDLYYLASTYGTTGNPTKNVTVTNWPVDEQGNLMVSVSKRNKLITLLKKQSFSRDQWLTVYANVSEYKSLRIFAQAESNGTGDFHFVGWIGTGDIWIKIWDDTFSTGPWFNSYYVDGPIIKIYLYCRFDEALVTIQIWAIK